MTEGGAIRWVMKENLEELHMHFPLFCSEWDSRSSLSPLLVDKRLLTAAALRTTALGLPRQRMIQCMWFTFYRVRAGYIVGWEWRRYCMLNYIGKIAGNCCEIGRMNQIYRISWMQHSRTDVLYNASLLFWIKDQRQRSKHIPLSFVLQVCLNVIYQNSTRNLSLCSF